MLHPQILNAIRFIFLGSLLLSALRTQAYGSRTDSLLRVLDQNLAHQTSYDKQRLDRLAALKAELRSEKADDNASFTLSLLICDEYQVFTYDSAFAYSLKLGPWPGGFAAR
ncbi:hypothetical protein MUN84_17820 [Hymenobacter sp. 5516J-16]|uniref:hypothetical protein n=1 Tax=Hymenobacter sp. 5516J-16 TaxID=2932253 RepID=UPI001FD40030|nr:hypothetical protein [Hymenobacter sp. 5516J-16]UOQ76394.1 hypothetical protein MUN84_17820 [Hymenobacter sp. 5516J-16]